MVSANNFKNFRTIKSPLLYFLILSFLLSLLNGCSTTAKDGPPSFDVDVSQIPDPKPKKEPPAKYGNMSKYTVFGKNYYVMKSARNYREVGIASWYGRKFHKQRTSSGETYNMLAMTAAHKSLPLPTYVEVTNLKNNRKVIVKVNDRGPFAPNRIIDLSYVAAKKLGMIGHGTTKVEVRALEPGERRSTATLLANRNTKTKYSKKENFLQVGAFKNREYAENLKNRLESSIAFPIEVTRHSKALADLYKVKIGPIDDSTRLDSIKKKLRAMGLTPTNIKA